MEEEGGLRVEWVGRVRVEKGEEGRKKRAGGQLDVDVDGESIQTPDSAMISTTTAASPCARLLARVEK